eukprot:CCRYP_016238-RA/>CCRYP_016238-RA protein AED:0.23 eAED:0.23 QI:201/1/1/1/1/1/4/2178/180
MFFPRFAVAAALCTASSSAFMAPNLSSRNVSPFTSSHRVSSLAMTATLSEPATEESPGATVMRPPIDYVWEDVSSQLINTFGYSQAEVDMYDAEVESNKEVLLKLYKALQMARGFENACNQQYMQGKIRDSCILTMAKKLFQLLWTMPSKLAIRNILTIANILMRSQVESTLAKLWPSSS